ncbi:hypothetical protein TO73_0849 [Thermus aquaticus Y51MC23]|uniref:Uncharacterized protein n=1 Tax=Thermus aquaticus (strain ATCC BAA-2747 / Y51MC23) TaxID=498848 RepID=A0ABM5VKL4_THEA5|nr:hypothetical protein TO73_0849 [Thermus aquaticus Y51MC23]
MLPHSSTPAILSKTLLRRTRNGVYLGHQAPVGAGCKMFP